MADGGSTRRTPIYWRLLRLRAVHPGGWQRALFIEGAAAVGLVLWLADEATAWTMLVLPVVVAAVVKAHDVLGIAMAQPTRPARPARGRKARKG